MAESSKKVLGGEISALFADDNIFRSLVNMIRVELEEKLEASLYCRKGEIGELFKEFINPPKEEKKDESKEDKVKLSSELAALVGQSSMSQSEAAKKISEIIEDKGLYDPQDKEYVICDEALMKVIGVKRFEAANMMRYLKNHFINEVHPTPDSSAASTSEGSSSAGTPMNTKDLTDMIGIISKEELRREIAAIRNRRSEEEECGSGLASPNTIAPNIAPTNVTSSIVTAPNTSSPNKAASNKIPPKVTSPNTAAPNMKTSNMSAPIVSAPKTSVQNTAESNLDALNKAARRISERNMATRDIIAPNRVAPNTGPLNIVVPKTITPLTLPPIILPLNVTASNNVPSSSVASNAVGPNMVAPSSVAPITVAPSSVAPGTISPNSMVPRMATQSIMTSFMIVPDVVTSNVIAPNVMAPNTMPSIVTAQDANTGDAEVPDVPEVESSNGSPCCHVT